MNKYRIAVVLCVVWLIGVPIFMGVEYLNSDQGVRKLNIVANVFTKINKSNVQALPKPTENITATNPSDKIEFTNSSDLPNKSGLSKVNKIIAKTIYVSRKIYNQYGTVCEICEYQYVDINSLFHRALGKRYHSKGFVRTENDSLVPCVKPIASDKIQIEELKEKIKRFKSFLDREGIDFLYVQLPSKNCKYIDRQYPTGTIGATPKELKADLLLQFCKLENIDYVDLREELFKAVDVWDEAFYKTDHHWKAETGFWAFQVVAKRLKEKYCFSFDEKIIQSSSYNFEPNYTNNYFLGSYGRKVGKYYCRSLDRITKIYPNFQTSYQADMLPMANEDSLPVSESRLEGTFEEVCLYERNLSKTAKSFDIHNQNSYCYYNNGDKSKYVLNQLSTTNKTILLVRDSYSCVFSPFLYGVCKEFHEIDLRNYHQESLVDCVARVKPDIVIIMAGYIFRPTISFEEKSTLDYNER